jgi:hypothetical protein
MTEHHTEQIFNLREAATYMGVNYYTFRRRVCVTKEVVPDLKVSDQTFIFYKSTLDKLKEEQSNILNAEQAAAYLNVSLNTLDYYVYYAPEERRLIPDNVKRTRRRPNQFSKATLDQYKAQHLQGQAESVTDKRRGPRQPKSEPVAV